MELRSYRSLCSLGVKPYAREFFRSYGVKELRSYFLGVMELRSYFLGVMELRSYHSLCSLGVKPYAWELFLRSYGVKELFLRS